MQETQEFYRCLVSDASSRALRQIRDILADGTLSDVRGSPRIVALVRLRVDVGFEGGARPHLLNNAPAV